MDGENCKFIFIPKTEYAAENCKLITYAVGAPKFRINRFKLRCLFIVFPPEQNSIRLPLNMFFSFSYIIYVFVR